MTGFDFLFIIAFLTGFLTLSRLNAVQEEGETSRDAAMEELLSNSAGMARMVNSVPGLAFAVQIPYGYLKNIPGMDVAVGVSAYQIAASTRAAAHCRQPKQDIGRQGVTWGGVRRRGDGPKRRPRE